MPSKDSLAGCCSATAVASRFKIAAEGTHVFPCRVRARGDIGGSRRGKSGRPELPLLFLMFMSTIHELISRRYSMYGSFSCAKDESESYEVTHNRGGLPSSPEHLGSTMLFLTRHQLPTT
jgi:hypothetical protein